MSVVMQEQIAVAAKEAAAREAANVGAASEAREAHERDKNDVCELAAGTVEACDLAPTGLTKLYRLCGQLEKVDPARRPPKTQTSRMAPRRTKLMPAKGLEL